jgi:uncharacterized protein (DUF1697 family)
MIRYVAFLRGINVGGNKLIKMEDLRRVFEASGFQNVRTYIQSGNVIFDTAEKNTATLVNKIEKQIHKLLGHEVKVLLQTVAELEDIVSRNPFKGFKPGDDIRMFVTFLSHEPTKRPRVPVTFSAENLEVLTIKNRSVFMVCRRKKNGQFCFPTAFIEKELGGDATTRSWTAVQKIVRFANTKVPN